MIEISTESALLISARPTGIAHVARLMASLVRKG